MSQSSTLATTLWRPVDVCCIFRYYRSSAEVSVKLSEKLKHILFHHIIMIFLLIVIVFNWNHFEMRLLNLRINFNFLFFYLFIADCPHLSSFCVLFLLHYVSAKFHLWPSSGDLTATSDRNAESCNRVLSNYYLP